MDGWIFSQRTSISPTGRKSSFLKPPQSARWSSTNILSNGSKKATKSSISTGICASAAHQNCRLAAQELGHVYVIDSCSLSTGMGLLVIEAGRRISHGMPAEQIYQEVSALATHSHASFILDTLEFMHAGGRCSAVTALGANLLRLKPCIEVNNLRGGAMKWAKNTVEIWKSPASIYAGQVGGPGRPGAGSGLYHPFWHL